MEDESRARISARRAVIVAVIAAAIVVIAVFASSASMRTSESATNKDSLSIEFISSQQGQKQERVETELITLEQTGFEPNEIRRPQGAFILGVDNRTGLEEIELRFVRADGQQLRALEARRRKISWREVVDLPPGEYLLSDANHPNWTCNITILPR